MRAVHRGHGNVESRAWRVLRGSNVLTCARVPSRETKRTKFEQSSRGKSDHLITQDRIMISRWCFNGRVALTIVGDSSSMHSPCRHPVDEQLPTAESRRGPEEFIE
ncbi:uncharacterized protein LOC122565804 [Bombus pyrosoma]|uniref:uncharacterized protein LOC122565804 n=1 Tax=Bombus pyrosoma TaxID=396416 RepID=UPI001CB8E0DB|nr:uncharacterized protein LOC122565804 [Bombus pyrosoma]